MFTISDAYSSQCRPVIEGMRGTISAAHPLAVSAGLRAYELGGTAADALISAQAVLCVVAPDACGLGGDMLALVHAPDGGVEAFNGTGAAPLTFSGGVPEGAMAVTVPGIIDAWEKLQARHARLPLSVLLAPAIRLAAEGFRVSSNLAAALVAQRARLIEGGADRGNWPLFDQPEGALVCLPALAALLQAIGREGARAFYQSAMAEATAAATRACGGCLAAEDLATHQTVITAPNSSRWQGLELMSQPPMTQGILLNMSLAALEQADVAAGAAADHAGIELTEAAFHYRARAGEGMPLMQQALDYDPAQALHRGGPRAYLHTAGVACADADGMVISSLVSVFDDFGSAVYVPEGGFTLNNRGAGFGAAPNDPAPGKRPIHTLAPAMLRDDEGTIWAFATPGADGQVQTLLQVLHKARREGVGLAEAIAAPRWRSENAVILIEDTHPHIAALRALGHDLRPLGSGDTRFGAVVVAGWQAGRPLACPDWRRLTAAGAV